ncbi:MAG: ABC transporter permease [Akkermansiaceae bacterium]|nr:ABC transporter permease [Akkermansiaceae bacterium]
MRRYIIRRLLLMPFTLIGITLLVFSLSRLVPGGPVERMLQEQSMAALSGDKTGSSETVSEDDLERLEVMFSLHEPIWKAYLQWLGILSREVQVERAEFNDEGVAYLTLTNSEGKSAVLEVQRNGTKPAFLAVPWMGKESWEVRLESPRQRAEKWARRHGITDEAQIRKYAESPACRRWRAVACRRVHDGLLQGSLGVSYKYHEPVGAMIRDRLPVSLYFGLLGALITYLVSVPLGVVKALHHRGWFDSLSSVAIFTGYAVPGFALGAVLLVYLGARLEWFPMYGITDPDFDSMSLGEQIKDLAMHTVLPLLCYVVSTFAMTTMMMKNSLMENISADYVRTAVAKGVSFRRAVWGHAFRNAFIPLASSLGGVFCTVVSGSILIERVFDIQGFGLLSFQALMDKDYSLVMGTLLLTSVLIILGNLLSDILVALIDPRIKFDHA